MEAPIEVTLTEKKADSAQERSSRSQIVQKSDGDLAEKAADDAYLSDKTRVVRREQSAKNAGEIGARTQAAQPATQNPSKSAERTKNKPVQLSDLGLKIQAQPQQKFEQDRRWVNAQTGESIRGGQYIQGMKEGETSALNTKEFVFFSYFDRVRRQLDQAWQPLLRGQIQKLYKTGRHLASNSDYTTRTLVTLSDRGEIVRVQVLEESGTFDLDQAAIDALNHAGPYPNPPRGLVNGSKQVQIRWDFILKT